MSLATIEAAIPHRAPFLLLDEIVSQSENEIHCRKTFTGEEFWYAGHYPAFPLTPGVLLCEAAMQAGAVLLAKFCEDREGVPVATRMNDIRFKRMVRPGEMIDIEVKLNERLSNAFYLTGKVSVAGKLAARLDFACTITVPQQES
jgi:3-hydroxyacyl-[acyl-carrier-protein] dehydratase